MQYGIDALIIVNGKDKTDSIVSCNFRGGKCDIVYNSGSRVYSYNSTNDAIDRALYGPYVLPVDVMYFL